MTNTGESRVFDLLLLVAIVGVSVWLYKSNSGSSENMALEEVESKTTEAPQEMIRNENPNVVPSVGNVLDINKAWNDTPTEGMFRGIKGTIAPANATGESSPTPVPGGLPVTDDNYCAVPTGFLGAAVKAWEQNKRQGLVMVDGVKIDMGQPGGNQFYDTNGDGCCDTYCRRVVKGGFWSCITPQSVTTQYDASKPTGTPCSHYGRNQGSKLAPLYPQ